MKNKVALLLFLTLALMSLLPMYAAYKIIGQTIESQQEIYKAPRLQNHLNQAQIDLKKLSQLDNSNEAIYKKRFEEIQDMKLIFGEDDYFSEKLKSSISKYFLFGLGIATFVSTLLGILLSVFINKIYLKAQRDLVRETKRANYLSEVAKWQGIAKKLAHEIRRPLQPITTWMSNLRSAYKNGENPDFDSILAEATEAVDEEVRDLNLMVGEFSKFAELPKINLEPVSLNNYLEKFVASFSDKWSTANLSLEAKNDVTVLLDKMLFKQVLTNLIENAVEANSDSRIEVIIKVTDVDGTVNIDVFNTGVTISEEIRGNIFEPYFSTKLEKKNMGIGLAVVKATVLEHNGSVDCLEESQGARFCISLPLGS